MSETKCILIVCYLLLSVVLQAHGQHAQSQAEYEMQMKKAQQMTRSCQKVVQATEDDLKELQTQQKPSSKSGKCLHACLMESIGLLVDGKLSVEKSTELIAEIAQGNNELFDIAKSISNDCAAIQDDDRCELAFKLMSCTEEGIEAHSDELRKILPAPSQQQQQQQQQQQHQQQQQRRPQHQPRF